MLLELRISDVALIEQARLEFGPGLNLLTGETGAGKSIVIDALGLVLGGRASVEVVRSGAERATVEATFDLRDSPAAVRVIEEEGLLDPDDAESGLLLLTREVSRSGRHQARVNGRLVGAGLLRRVAAGLLDIHGQNEHQAILQVATHRPTLDAFGGPELAAARRKVEGLAGQLLDLVRERERLIGGERERVQRLDLLRHQIEEIASAAPQPGEDEGLEERIRILANAERLLEAAAGAYARLYEGDAGEGGDTASMTDGLAAVVAGLREAAAFDGRLAAIAETVEGCLLQIEEAARDLREYRDGLTFDPAELAEAEERREALRRLKRKYGDSLDEVIAYRADAERELAALEAAEIDAASLEGRIAAAREELTAAAAMLSGLRREAGQALERRIAGELGDLGLTGASFTASIVQVEKEGGLPLDGREVAWDRSGADQVEFLFSANVGEPVKPLAKVASGGEASRVMLALKTALSEIDGVPSLVFDEVDAGIGGDAGRVVGRKLAALAGRRQVICVTHLPQIACLADRHFYIFKSEVDGRTVTTVEPLAPGERAAELARMLGGRVDDAAALEHARELLRQAEDWKGAAS